MNRFIEWDYRTGVATEYKRGGECKRCGKCCQAKICFEANGRPYKGSPRNGLKEPNDCGIWQEVQRGRWRFFYQMVRIETKAKQCDSLGDGNLCQCQDDKPGICRDWPMAPVCTAQFPECGFTFEVWNTWKINGKAKQS